MTDHAAAQHRASPAHLVVTLLSGTAVAQDVAGGGEVDVEVRHDELGLPVIGGKSLHGLLRDTWLSAGGAFPELRTAAGRVLGRPGDLTEHAIFGVGDAVMPADTREWVAYAIGRDDGQLTAWDILRAVTDVRAQTAEERGTGAPARATLRRTRVVLRGTTLIAPLTWLEAPTADDRRCLAVCVLGTRHLGLGRNRGLGHVAMTLDGDIQRTRTMLTGGAG